MNARDERPPKQICRYLPIIATATIAGVLCLCGGIFHEGMTPDTASTIATIRVTTTDIRKYTSGYEALFYQGQLQWEACMAIYIILCIVGVFLYGGNILRARDGVDGKRHFNGLLVGYLLVCGAILLKYHSWHVHPPHAVFDQLIDATVGSRLPNFKGLFLWFDAFGIAVSVLLPLATGSLLAVDADKWFDGVELAERVRRLNFLLYFSACFLVAAVLRLSSLFQWCLTFLNHVGEDKSPIASYQAIEAVTNSMATAMGVVYTLFLLAAYFPVSSILQKRARSVLRASKDGDLDAETKAILSAPGFHFEDFAKLAAVLSPLLTGPITAILGHLK